MNGDSNESKYYNVRNKKNENGNDNNTDTNNYTDYS